MKIAMVGLGKMGANMTQRLIEHGHQVVAFDLSERRPVGGGQDRGRTGGHPRGAGRQADRAPGGLGHGPGRRGHQLDHHHLGRAVRAR